MKKDYKANGDYLVNGSKISKPKVFNYLKSSKPEIFLCLVKDL